MGVFTVDAALCTAASDAAHALGVIAALAEPRTVAQLAEQLRVRPRRLAALIDALLALGVLRHEGARIACAEVPAPSAQPLHGGWGALADVIRRDAPLAVADAEVAARYHRHLLVAGAPAADEVAAVLAGVRRVADLGGGAGTYARALLAQDADVRVTLVDAAPVIALARTELAAFGERVAFVAGDAREVELAAHDVALVANVLHLHAPDICAAIVAAAARAVRPGGTVAIVDLRPETREGAMFALNMAVYTEGGSVYGAAQLATWLAAAGCVEVGVRALAAAPEMMLVTAERR